MIYAKRELLANKLNWLEEKLKVPGIPDLRKDARIVPTNPHTTLTLADGTVHGCFVVDMSSSGAAVSAELQPQVGNAFGRGGLHWSRRQTAAQLASRSNSSNRRAATISSGG